MEVIPEKIVEEKGKINREESINIMKGAINELKSQFNQE